jgi:hypothetical protein
VLYKVGPRTTPHRIAPHRIESDRITSEEREILPASDFSPTYQAEISFWIDSYFFL